MKNRQFNLMDLKGLGITFVMLNHAALTSGDLVNEKITKSKISLVSPNET